MSRLSDASAAGDLVAQLGDLVAQLVLVEVTPG
jgi:hypothetical protein